MEDFLDLKTASFQILKTTKNGL